MKKYKVLLLLLTLYLLLRVINLNLLPIFNDEATYLDWSYRHINLKGEFFHSVYHAKPPLFMWLVGLLRKIITNPLTAGRLFSVIAGALTAYGLYKIAKEIFNKRAAQIAFLLYIIIPIFAFYDRQALMEASVAASGIWSFYFFLKMSKTKNYKYAAILGTVLGLGYLIKTSAIVFFLAIVFLSMFENIKDKKARNVRFTNIVILISTYLVILSPLLLHPAFWQTLADNKRYIFTLNEIIKLPLSQWLKNINNFLIIVTVYLSPFVLLTGLISIFYALKNRKTDAIYAIFLFISGTFFAVFIGRLTNVRHTVAFLPIFLIFPAYLISKSLTKNKIFGTALLVLTAALPTFITGLLIFSPPSYFNTLDRVTIHSQKKDYVSYWSSGYGFDEVREYLKEISKNRVIIVGVRLDAGIPENAVFTYFSGSKRVLPVYLDERLIRNFDKYECLKSQLPVYFVSRDNQLAGLEKHLTEIKKVYKPESQHYIGIHKLKEDCVGETLKLN